MGQLDGKVALVTGANSGIGRATAVLFAEEGAKVFCVSRRVDANQEVVDQIVEEGGIAASVSADLSVQEECRKAVDACIAEYGRVDVLVNSAGIADKHKPINKCEEDWYDMSSRSTSTAPTGCASTCSKTWKSAARARSSTSRPSAAAA